MEPALFERAAASLGWNPRFLSAPARDRTAYDRFASSTM